MTKSRKVGFAVSVLLIFILVLTVAIPLHTVNNANVASAVTVVSRDQWVNSYSGTYYNNLNENLTGSAFRSELANLITTTHKTETSYDSLKTHFKTTDADPNQSGNVIWFYTGNSIPYTGAMDSGNYPTNREHVWPKMAGKAFPESSKAGSDAHHLRPLNTGLNNTRNNYQFGEVSQTTGNRVYQTGTLREYGTSDPDTWCYLANSTFYPAKGYRGATARILFYVQTRWGDDYSLNFVTGLGNTKTMGDVATLLKWHLEEPPTDEEIRRNEAVAKIQGNRNPFIDHPEYAEMIYCNDGSSYNNSLKNVVAQYGSYLDNSNVGTDTLQKITLSQSVLNLNVGETSQQITVTATPSNASNSVTWSSSNANVATVSNGVVTAVGIGKATITAKSVENPNITASIVVTVNSPEENAQVFHDSMDALENANTLEQRYNAIKNAIEAYNLLSNNDKAYNSDEYAKLRNAIVAYNNEINGINEEMREATNLASQAVALSVSTCFLALVLIVIKRVL